MTYVSWMPVEQVSSNLANLMPHSSVLVILTHMELDSMALVIFIPTERVSLNLASLIPTESKLIWSLSI